MTEDEIFIDLVKTAIDKYPIISGSCQKCPIRFIERNLSSRNKINDKYAYLNKNAEYEGSTCFLIAQKIQLLKIAKVNGIFFNKANHGYIACSNVFESKNPKIKIIKFYNFNKI